MRKTILVLLMLPGPAASQQLDVVRGYEGMRSYAMAARAQSSPDLGALYKEHVVDPYWRQCAAGTRYESLAAGAVASPIEDLEALLEAVDLIRGSDIERRVEEGFTSAARLLPGGPTTVCLFAADPQDTFVRDVMNGVSGFSPGAGRIWLFAHSESAWRDEIASALAHEYHHSVSLESDGEDPPAIDLLESILLEGRADSFALLLYPEKSFPWIEALTPAEEQDLWRRMEPQLGTTDEAIHSEFLFGGQEIPRWGGYTIGFRIVQAYLRGHPDVPVERWTRLGAHALLEQSGYRAGR